MRTLVVLGGGAAGFFGAIRAAEVARGARVLLLEAGSHVLGKVRISGGGRCNVTHHLFEPRELVKRYPRGAAELRGAFARFGPRETIQWFETQGVALKVEEDGRMFPTTDDSDTIVQALVRRARALGVDVRTRARTAAISPAEGGFSLTLADGATLEARGLLLATGSAPQGHAFARALGHTIVPPVPSLFTFDVKDTRLDGLAGVSLPHARMTLVVDGARDIEQSGPLLVTHRGVSGPGILRLSAFGARELARVGYRAKLRVDLAPQLKEEDVRALAQRARDETPRASVGAHPLAGIPRRLWERILAHGGVDITRRHNELSRKDLHVLVQGVKASTFDIVGKAPFADEFVTAGGVTLDEVDFRTMESRVRPGLHFAGEILDVDAVTGGFNFQAAWTTGFLAGSHLGA